MPLARGARRAPRNCCARVGLGERLTHRPGMLSGGEQQRVAVARALVMQPALLLADEPTGDLDEQTAESLHALLREMHRTYGLTSVIATHNPRLAAACDRVLRLEGGRLIAPDATRDLMMATLAALALVACGSPSERAADRAGLPSGSAAVDRPMVEPVDSGALQALLPIVAGWERSIAAGERMTSPITLTEAWPSTAAGRRRLT